MYKLGVFSRLLSWGKIRDVRIVHQVGPAAVEPMGGLPAKPRARGRRPGETSKKNKNSPQHWLRYTNLGVEFALSFGAFVALGWWVGRHFGWNPWAMLVGAALGFIGAMYNLIRMGLKMAREAEAERRGDERIGHSSRRE